MNKMLSFMVAAS